MLVFLIVLVLTIGLCILSSRDIGGIGVFALALCGGFATIIMLALIIFSNATGNISYEKAMAEREVIEYQLENQTFVNDNFVGTNELFTQIGKFNGKVKSRQRCHNSIWTSWFYSGIWDKIELIDISQYNIQG